MVSWVPFLGPSLLCEWREERNMLSFASYPEVWYSIQGKTSESLSQSGSTGPAHQVHTLAWALILVMWATHTCAPFTIQLSPSLRHRSKMQAPLLLGTRQSQDSGEAREVLRGQNYRRYSLSNLCKCGIGTCKWVSLNFVPSVPHELHLRSGLLPRQTFPAHLPWPWQSWKQVLVSTIVRFPATSSLIPGPDIRGALWEPTLLCQHSLIQRSSANRCI